MTSAIKPRPVEPPQKQIPIWYLDIDGVVNVLMPEHPAIPAEHRRSQRVTNWLGEFPINWDSRVVDFINDVHRSGRAEICWLTTWETDALEQFAPAVGLDAFRCPPVRFVHLPKRSINRGKDVWSKWESVLRFTDKDKLAQRDMIWTDDDLQPVLNSNGLSPGPEIHRWVGMRRALGLRTLGISPKPHRGLTPEHLAEIEKLLDAQPAALQPIPSTLG